ncbi:hypothetical protein LZ575_05310 [Antarcticibacterium sp. 1MA-6-2]|uniref:hypothetical protein n=1 Tax=Antarcticibacterium sp. 1MA-6-2 TaxID=2908210 RepID=UPI001F15E204|nr:hypothetical protein [Antarcticibacterium sp. 1MA-6-2]UJH92029.1 hypothetical protein LZ575_05310 [Antarcticibacterium sp. 1MA-6-2]
MNNLIQLLITAILSSFSIAEEAPSVLSSLPKENLEIKEYFFTVFLPEEESQWFDCEKVYYYSPVRVC